jgi:ApbE superfamily uncharacterized protein (UPF0280 family)
MTQIFQQMPCAKLLPDGHRLHLQHGPIDLIIEAFGPGPEKLNQQLRRSTYQLAEARFQTILEELVGELKKLRQPCETGTVFSGKVACRMQRAVEHLLPEFITPMAAVAGAVADEVLATVATDENIRRIYVNNGGDTAFHLADGQSMTAAIAAPFEARIFVHSTDPYRGIATSGWRGRSQSLGIADSVSVVARNCATADAAATMIANAVDLPGHASVSRLPACEIMPDSDLGERLVTTGVGKLSDQEIDHALSAGERTAQTYVDKGIIGGAMLLLKNQSRQIGNNNLIKHAAGELANA